MRRRPRAILPAFLEPGDLVGVCAPSGRVDAARLRAGIAYLRRRGHPVLLAPHARASHGYLAGADDVRAEDLNGLIASDAVRAILFARGGYGLTRILDRVDLDGLRRRPKLLIGFSDVTALFMALQRRGPYLVHYGPVVSELGESEAFDETSLWTALHGPGGDLVLPLRARDVLRPGRATGPLLGGCLTLLCALVGTRDEPDYRGAILFWEEVAEEPYRIDRMLTHLRNAGRFEGLRGMIVGGLSRCEPAAGAPSLSLRRILEELTADYRFPVVWNVRSGHVAGKITLPLGGTASIDAPAGALILRRGIGA